MTEKVKLTQKQFDWLERYKSEEEIDYAIDIQLHRKRPDSPVADWKPSEVARAFYNGYEVGLQYKVGGWVVRLDGDPFNTKHLAAKIAVVHSTRLELEGQFGSFSYDFIDHATPEEIKAEQKRRKWAEIEKGDVVISIISGNLAKFFKHHPEHGQVEVGIRNARYEMWDEDKCKLYAKKVGESNA